MIEASVTHCLCPSCGAEEQLVGEVCVQCNASLLLHEKYYLTKVLGQSTGITYLARDIDEDQQVVIKELAFRRMDAWKTEELFLREAEVLRKLKHPRIPTYLDHFSEGQGKQQSHYLVQSFLPGKNLQQLLDDVLYKEEEVLTMLQEVLVIIEYLHEQRPPVIHRDLKPSNLMRGEDGAYSLIDFGSVKDLSQQESRGETVAGTFGYMAPEQFQGKATPKSDLYALGIVALVLLSRRTPDTFMDVNHALSWQDRVTMSTEMRELLEKFLIRNPEERVESAKEAAKLVERTKRTLAGEVLHANESHDSSTHKFPYIGFDGFDDPAQELHDALDEEDPYMRDWEQEGSSGLGASMVLVIPALFLFFFTFYVIFAKKEEPLSPPVVSMHQARPPLSPPPKSCEPSKCKPLPMGLLGLKFGMTLKQVKAHLPHAKFEKQLKLPNVSAKGDLLMAAVGGLAHVTIPGHRIYATTRVLGQPSRCQMDFGIEYTLSSIECRLRKASGLSHHGAERLLLGQLYANYGKAHTKKQGRHFFLRDVRMKLWEWKGKESSVLLSSGKSDPKLNFVNPSKWSRIELSVTWNRWTKLYKMAKKEANRRAKKRKEGVYIRKKWPLPPLWRLPKPAASKKSK